MNWCADTLTDIAISVGECCCQCWRSAHACSSTQRPSSTICPDCSANGMNTVGATGPRAGCVQRSSASTPVTPAVGGVDDRLIVEMQLTTADRAGQPARQSGLVSGEMQLTQVKHLMASDPVAF